MMKNYLGKVVLLFGLVVVLSGCGGGSSFFSALGDAFATGGFSSGGSSGGGFSTATLSSGGSSGGSSGSSLSGGDSGGMQVALVHNPEPASMLLWGIGLAGAALARRRRKGYITKCGNQQ